MRPCLPSALVLAMGVMGHAGCSASPPAHCGAIAVVVPMITVADAATGQPICDATVTATCGDAGAKLVAYGPHGYQVDAAVPGCHYGPTLEASCNVATISISKTGYMTTTVPDVEVRYSTECPGPIPDAQLVNVMLELD